jgi:ubiquinone/menaquinone biosynthesis C-methylase UbiE
MWWWAQVTTTRTREAAKACCAAAYGSDIAALLLGDSYHPGGLSLTRRLAGQLGLSRDAHVLDVASGPGASAMMLAGEFGLRVAGLDLSAANVALAQGRADAEGQADRVSFAVGDAERLPYPDAAFDAVVVECALCTFPNKPAAAAETSRVLCSGGRLGLTDVVADPDRLPAELTPQRVASTLATLAAQQRRYGVGHRSPVVALTHEQIAALAGTFRETATKVLGDYAERGLIRLGRGRITVLDIAQINAEGGD